MKGGFLAAFFFKNRTYLNCRFANRRLEIDFAKLPAAVDPRLRNGSMRHDAPKDFLSAISLCIGGVAILRHATLMIA